MAKVSVNLWDEGDGADATVEFDPPLSPQQQAAATSGDLSSLTTAQIGGLVLAASLQEALNASVTGAYSSGEETV